MLDGLERKVVAVVGDAVAARTLLDAVQLAGAGDEPAAGRNVVRLGVESVAPEAGFERDVIALSGTPDAPLSRRVLPVRFTVAAHFAARPAGTTPAERTAARTLLLGDVSAVAHALADPAAIAGRTFDVVGDPGFSVSAFTLAAGDLDPDAAGGDAAVLRATLRWDGRGLVWPVTPPGPEGVVRAVDVELVPVPLRLSALEPVVTQGASTIVTIDGVAGRRITSIDPPADEPLAVAVSVTSDLPPADRGSIDGGTAGVEQGVRIVPIEGPGTTVTYRAPTAALGTTTVEFVAVHLATREGERGAFVDALPIRLVGSP